MKKTPNNNEKDIQKLAEKYINTKDSNDFGKLYSRIKYGLRTYIFNIVKNSDFVDDVESIVLEKVWKNIHMYDPYKAKFSTWLYKIAYFDSIQYITRKTRKHNNILSEDIQDLYVTTLVGDNYTKTNTIIFQEDFDFIVNDGEYTKVNKDDIAKELVDVSINCINDLPEIYRFVLEEKLLKAKTIIQISEDNNIPTTTVKNRLFYGKKMLKEQLLKKHKNLYTQYQDFDLV